MSIKNYTEAKLPQPKLHMTVIEVVTDPGSAESVHVVIEEMLKIARRYGGAMVVKEMIIEENMQDAKKYYTPEGMRYEL